MTDPPPDAHGTSRPLPGVLARLTALFWALIFVTFSGSIASTISGPLQAWMWVWLVAICITGFLWSVALAVGWTRPGAPGRWRRWLLLLGAVIVVSAGQTLLDGALHDAIADAFSVHRDPSPGSARHILNWIIYFWVYGFYALMLALVGELRRTLFLERANAAWELAASRERERATRVREQAGKAQLDALRFQIDPHFLFNSLNGISSLVLAGRPAEAEAMIQKFVVYLRNALKDSDGGLVTLEQELRSAAAYLDVEGARFAHSVALRVDCPPGLRDAVVPNLILRPLMERAVLHAVESNTSETMRVTVRKEEPGISIEVCCAGPREAAGPDLPPAFTLVQSRLEAAYGAAAAVSGRNTRSGLAVRLAIPLLRNVETIP